MNTCSFILDYCRMVSKDFSYIAISLTASLVCAPHTSKNTTFLYLWSHGSLNKIVCCVFKCQCVYPAKKCQCVLSRSNLKYKWLQEICYNEILLTLSCVQRCKLSQLTTACFFCHVKWQFLPVIIYWILVVLINHYMLSKAKMTLLPPSRKECNSRFLRSQTV